MLWHTMAVDVADLHHHQLCHYCHQGGGIDPTSQPMRSSTPSLVMHRRLIGAIPSRPW